MSTRKENLLINLAMGALAAYVVFALVAMSLGIESIRDRAEKQEAAIQQIGR